MTITPSFFSSAWDRRTNPLTRPHHHAALGFLLIALLKRRLKMREVAAEVNFVAMREACGALKTGLRFSVVVEHGRQFPAFGDEADGEGVDAMAGVPLREVFAFEDVAQVAAAVGADYLGAMPVRVRMGLHSPGVFFIEAGPAAA